MRQLDGITEFEQALGAGDGQGGLACYSPGVAKSWTRLSDRTELTACLCFHLGDDYSVNPT